MPKTANINLRIEPEIKAQADAVFSSLGISVTDAINVFLHVSIMEGGFPFQPKRPRYNRETLMAMQEARDIMEGKVEAKRYSSFDELLKDVDAEEVHA
ncbi:DNA-damage-inducible protein J [Selenomonas ruminantium]|jgi:DNA-damage-inducible protein J|uniref:DNA-damage-inducible protein J n=1 Tax=Selenomonas ruminantium TaxID=971 RepID=A0A1I3GAJ7_SELRU|nr:type II toxin-antitoxin system RelB/DinJ family antitoxin [Selenomonas ruminantium]SFI20437.1 DNA-damage-inducible protein J [Selenomonas ruminantium]